MTKHNELVLINDECEACQYVSHAFSLLGLPLKRMDLPTFADQMHQQPIVLVCPVIEMKAAKALYQALNAQQASMISLRSDAERRPTELPLQCLKMPFTAAALKHSIAVLRDMIAEPAPQVQTVLNRLIGNSDAIKAIRHLIIQVAESDATVLILGQSGTGKDVIATCIHQLSARRENPYVPINCGAIPHELIESELFGHEKGAFTGALSRRAGRFEMAANGTLFLDEIGDMPLPMQVKLLRVIQDRIIERVGGNTSIKVDVRLIAATNKNLTDEIHQHHFREDLFYRLNVFPIHVPSLAERKEDIPVLIEHLLDKMAVRLKHRIDFTEKALEHLTAYAWPGNIRELENFLERMVIIHRDSVVDEKHLDAEYKIAANPKTAPVLPAINHEGFNIKEYIADVERQMIEFALSRSNGIVNVAANYLAIGRSTLVEKMKRYNLA